jgi:hypothetical protein
MYSIDQHDRVKGLSGVPQSCVGAPRPVIVCDEATLLLAYYIEDEKTFPAGHVVNGRGYRHARGASCRCRIQALPLIYFWSADLSAIPTICPSCLRGEFFISEAPT